MRLQIDNEYAQLEAVMVHRPGREIDRLTHDNMRRFLFEDVPYLRRMQDEHDTFTSKIREHGVEVLYLEDMLLDVIKNANAREALLTQVCQATPAIVESLATMQYWNEEQLVEMLFAGLTEREFSEATGSREAAHPDTFEEHFLLAPIPNAYFSRDPAVVVRDAAVSCKMHYAERVRETLLVRSVLEHHPAFDGVPLTYGGTDEPTEDRPYTIEGGDILVLSPEALLIGVSERTRSETIELLAGKCFEIGNVRRIYEIPIPSNRAFMHLDTVFTIVDRGTVLWFPPVMERVTNIHRLETDENGDERSVLRVRDDRSIQDILRDEFACDLTIIPTAGGERPFDAREQRSDGNNAVAIAPKTVITYDRNERTNRALDKAGVVRISINGSELVRGLGGPRCMTMPLRRRL